ncbi:Lrp/AsnC family transcriptional regulator [[Eubacterium] cellulosolvens]
MTEKVMAIININVQSKKLGSVTERLIDMKEVIDAYEVTGESDIIALVETQDIPNFRDFTKNKLLKIDGIRNSISSFVLFTHKKDGKKRR